MGSYSGALLEWICHERDSCIDGSGIGGSVSILEWCIVWEFQAAVDLDLIGVVMMVFVAEDTVAVAI